MITIMITSSQIYSFGISDGFKYLKTNVIDYDYIAFESNDYEYDYLRSCNRLQSIMITDYDYPIPGLKLPDMVIDS